MTRVDIIQNLINKFNYKSYLEIGVASGESFFPVNCNLKVGVDPRPDGPATVRLTSDEYFLQYPDDKFDIIFIDGLHHSEQVTRDIENSLRVLNVNGIIVMHDCSPTTEYMQQVPCPSGIDAWTGDVWKSFIQLRQNNMYEAFVVDTDFGVAVIKPDNRTQQILNITEPLTYDNLVRFRKEWLNLRTPEQFITWLNA